MHVDHVAILVRSLDDALARVDALGHPCDPGDEFEAMDTFEDERGSGYFPDAFFPKLPRLAARKPG